MCRRVECPTCGKPTFAGCGMHIEQVLGDVRPENRCRCNENAQAASASFGTSPSVPSVTRPSSKP